MYELSEVLHSKVRLKLIYAKPRTEYTTLLYECPASSQTNIIRQRKHNMQLTKHIWNTKLINHFSSER